MLNVCTAILLGGCWVFELLAMEAPGPGFAVPTALVLVGAVLQTAPYWQLYLYSHLIGLCPVLIRYLHTLL